MVDPKGAMSVLCKGGWLGAGLDGSMLKALYTIRDMVYALCSRPVARPCDLSWPENILGRKVLNRTAGAVIAERYGDVVGLASELESLDEYQVWRSIERIA